MAVPQTSTRDGQPRERPYPPNHTYMPMMHPEDEANIDAPLVPDLRRRNRTTRDRRTPPRPEIEPLRRELAMIRSRLDGIEARLPEETDPR